MKIKFIFVAVVMMCLIAEAGYCQQSLSDVAAVPKTIPQKSIRLLSWGKDPFVSPIKDGKGAVMPSSLKLSAILYAKDKPSAIINKDIVYIGDVIDGQKIVDIKKGYVILQNKMETYKLEINKISGKELYLKEAK